eukprot:TRINITY_DN20429_c0_g1_i3.p1 TRINITY_DN20429_c0_g1~~TRINITY_DN20429_c0_g1_i3.p1  ORF type:complete len:280 (-),score=28.67 TRINITY_DN20429_c0_g1_i3:43-882(-)
MMRALHVGVALLPAIVLASAENGFPLPTIQEVAAESNASAVVLRGGSAASQQCVKKHSLGRCEPCFSSLMCAQGWYCCPYMKKCVTRGTRCFYPIADCRPSCFNDDPSKCNCGNPDFRMNKWQKPLCGSEPPSQPPPSNRGCVQKHSLGRCEPCFSSEMCAEGWYCCPYMKKCVTRGTHCPYPIADCRPSCFNNDPSKCRCGNPDFKMYTWQKPLCRQATLDLPAMTETELASPGSLSNATEIVESEGSASSLAPSLRGSTAESAPAMDSSSVVTELYP